MMLNITLQLVVISTALGLTLGCGGYYVGTGNITSPNYPNQYPVNSLCIWTLTATAENDILLRMINLDTEKGYDFIKVYKGIVEENVFPSNYLRRYSGQINESSYYKEGNETLVVGPTATVMFFSDNSVEASGFLMEFSSVNVSHYIDCGGVFIGSGNITSPNFPSTYPSNSRCFWTLIANPSKNISIRIINFSTESSYDHVSVFDGTRRINSSLDDYSYRYSGWYYNGISNNGSKLILMGTSATILFVSDSSISASGFHIEFTSIDMTQFTACEDRLFGSGNITSPNYPNQYPMNSRCTWTLFANPGGLISLRMIRFDTESLYDYLYVFNGTKTSNSSLSDYFRRYSGPYYFRYDSKPMLMGPTATIVFISDPSVSLSGFQMEYTSIDLSPNTGCGDRLFGSGNITSPNYPNRYPMSIRCTWTLFATPGSFISLRMISLDTEYLYDYLYVFNGTRTSNSSLSDYSDLYTGKYNVGSYYYYRSAPKLIGPTATIVFISDSSVTASGFQLEYASIDLSSYTGCGGSLFGAGNITSPNYPYRYPLNCRCTWTLTAHPGTSILLRIISMDTASSYDYVYVFSGTRTSNSSLSDYSNRFSGYVYYTVKPMLMGPSATIVFISESSVSASGFQIEYTNVDVTPFTGCGGSLFGAGNITSPNYPNRYPLNCRCTWTLTANPGTSILLRIIRMDTESSYDYVYVFSGTSTSNSSLSDYSNRFSGYVFYTEKPMLIGPSATIVFISDSSVSESGFHLEYLNVHLFTGCGGSLVGAGNITSPNYPNQYPMNSRCTWTLTANPGSYILLRIIRLDTERSYDYVYVFNETRASNSSLSDYSSRYSGLYYSDDNTPKLMLMVQSATIVFISDSAVSASGFQIEYANIDVTPFTECGGVFFGSGNITSPHFPNTYPPNSRCFWTLNANPNTFLSLRIFIVDTESSYDQVFVFDGTRTINSSLDDYSYRYSGGRYTDSSYIDRPKIILNGPTATILFVSDSSISASGFQIEYTSIDMPLFTGCGGDLFGAGNITSPNYPSTYPLNSRCLWTLTANPGEFILLRIINIDIENSYDYVAVLNDTANSNAPLKDYPYLYRGHKVYGINDSPKPILVGPLATIIFISDFSISASGFQMEYTSINLNPYTGCGDRFFGSGNITSPNYPNQYPMNSRCTWTLSANRGGFISLKMIRFDTESLYDYLYVFNGTITLNSSLSDYLIRYSGRYYNGSYYYSSKPVVTGPNATIIFISDSSVSASGFQMEYTSIDVSPYTDCGGDLVGSVTITSPKYPNIYPLNSHCRWRLCSTYTSLDMYMRIISVDTESSYDYIKVFSSEAGYSHSYSGRDYCPSKSYYCATEPIIVGPEVTITFISDSSVSASGFHIEFFDGLSFKGCGGSLFGAGNITSPNYPNRYEWNTVCTWTLTANPGTYISLRIITMDLYDSYDNVYVFNGSRTSNTSLANYSYLFSGVKRDNCGGYNCSSKPMLIGPKATIIFASRSSGLGFQIEYASVDVTTSADSVATITTAAEGETTTAAAAATAVVTTTAAETGATSETPPVRTSPRCKLRRNTTTSALPNA